MLSAIHVHSKFLALMLDAAFRALLLGCFLAAVLAVLRICSVRAKLVAWRGLLLVALAMPLLIWLSPAVPLPIPVPSFSRPAEPVVVQPAQTVADYAMAETRSVPEGQMVVSRNSINSSADWSVYSDSLPALSSPSLPRRMPWTFLATMLYFAIALLFFARVLIGMYFGARLRLGSKTVSDVDGLILLSSAGRAARLRTLPRLAESEAVAVPLTFGIIHPAILLPSSWREWSRDELAAVLAHEASHVARRDSLVQLLALIHRAVFWFNPLSWWLNRHLADLAEQASDEAALAGGAERTRYAQALVGFLADLEESPNRVWWHGVAMAKTGDGEKRVDRILAWRRSMPSRMNKYLVAAAIAICVPALALSVAAHPSTYDPQDFAAPPSPAPPPPPQQIVPPPDAVPASPAASMAAPVVPSVVPPAPPETAQPNSNGSSQVAVAAPAPPQPPQSQQPPSPDAAPPTPPPAPATVEGSSANWGDFAGAYGPYWPWGPRFMIVTRDSNKPLVIGTISGADAERVGELRSRIPGDFIWFEKDNGKSYIIRDQATIDRAKQIWAQRGDSSKLQQDLQAKEQALEKQMHEQVQAKMQEIRVKIPDMSAEMQKLQSEIKGLNANGATMQQLGDLQRQVGQLQQALGEARWNSNMEEINRRAGEIGRQMGNIGRQIGELARQSVEQARQSSQQMRQLLNDAIANGKAKPE